MTARDIITGALRLLGELASGEQPSASEAADGLKSLNDLIDSWATERLLVYSIQPMTFNWIPGKKSYTLGPNGDWNTANRPVRVEQVQFNYLQNSGPAINMPLTMIDFETYQNFRVPDTASPIPLWVYVDGGFPLQTLYFYNVPSSNQAVQIFTWQQLGAFPDLSTDVPLPQGYARALRFNLAGEIAPEYGTALPQQAVAIAMESKGRIKSINAVSPLMQTDGALLRYRGGYNYLSDERT